MVSRLTYGSLSLVIPAGFVDETTIAIGRPPISAADAPLDPVTTYPLNLTLVRDRVGQAPDPVRYLAVKLGAIGGALQGFVLRQSPVAELLGDYPAAAAHFSFVARFQLEQLILVWFAGPTLMTATVSTTAPGVDEGWRVLREVAASVELG